MARSLRIEFPGAYYHITSRGNERKNIYRTNKDREKFLSYLKSAHHPRIHDVYVINEKMKIATLQLIIFISLLIILNIVTSNSSTVTIEKSEGRNINPEDVNSLNENSSQEKPRIVDHFACSDYCPGPDKDYWVKIYEGIKDKDECLKLGGRPATYYGWGEFHICIAE